MINNEKLRRKFFLQGIGLIFICELFIMFILEPMQLPTTIENILDPILLSLMTMYPFWRMTVHVVRANEKVLTKEFNLEKNFYQQQLEGLNRAAIVALSDTEGNIIFANDIFCETTGYHLSELVGKNLRIVNSGQHTSEFWKEMWDTISKGKIWNGEIRNRKKDGSFYWISATLVPILDGKGLVHEYLNICFDITKQKDLMESLEEEKAKLIHSSRMATMGEMSGGLAHEMNTPLAIIVGKAGHVMRKVSLGKFTPEELLRDLDKIEDTAMRISKIINGLKAFSGSGETMPYTKTNLRTVIQETLDLIGEKLRLQGIEIHINAAETDEVTCQPVQISQVLMNLILNAKDAIESRSDRIIWIDTKKVGDLIEISVMDSGPGVPEKISEKIMNPFFTTKPVGKGTGLGLSISKGIIDQHGGQFFLDRRSHRTRFVIRLPISSSENLKVG